MHARYVYDFFLQDQSSIRFRIRSKVSASKYFLPFPAMTRFSFFLSHLSIYPFSILRSRDIYWKTFEEHSGTPMYRQNKVIERENRAQQIYSMRNICVRMCMCLYIYIESDRDSEATYHRVGKLIMEAHLSIHYGVIRLISRRNTRTEYVFFSIRFSNSFRDSFCFRFSVSSLDLSFLPDRVCFFSRFHANSRYTEITRKVIRKEKKKNKTRIVPGYFVSEAARRRIIDRVAGFFVVRQRCSRASCCSSRRGPIDKLFPR